MSENSPKNVEITFHLRGSPVRRETKKGAAVAALQGVQVGAKGEKITKIALFAEPAESFLTSFEEQAHERGEDPESFQPIVVFIGNWKKNEWRGKEEWEFWAKEFRFQ